MKAENLKGIIETIYGFSGVQKENMKTIIDAIENTLEGSTAHWSSGSGYFHLSFKRNDNTWMMFHAVTGDITISEPYETTQELYDAFWSDDSDLVCGTFLVGRVDVYGDGTDKNDFEMTDLIIKDILEENFEKLF